MKNTKRHSLDPANFFLVAGLLLGIFYCIAIPYGAGFDEERHLVRIYYMSEYHLLPNFPNQVIHEDVATLSYQRRLVQSPAFDMFSKEIFLRRFSTLDKYRYGETTQSIYSPLIFFPQALIGRLLWWKYDFPILPTIILQKIVGMLIYIAAAYIMIRVTPYGKWILTALALLPAALYQAATLNADGFTVAVSFAFIGCMVSTYMNERSGITPRSVIVLSVLSILLGLSKPAAIILLPLLLILFKHPFPSKKWIAVLLVSVMFAVVANIGWWRLASQSAELAGGELQNVSQQSDEIFSNPIGFIKSLLQGMILTFPSQLQGWIAAYGYWAGKVPSGVYFFSVVFLLAAFFSEPSKIKIPWQARIFLVGMSIFCCAGIYAFVFAANFGDGLLALVKHGRYNIPFVPLLFLGFAGLFVVRESFQALMKQLAIVSFLLVHSLFSFGIYTTYYTYCSYDAYLGQPCTLPVYKNLEKEGGNMTGISSGEKINQTFTNQCGQLEEVQVFVKSIPEINSGILRFSLLDESHQELASKDFSVHEVNPFSYISLPVQLPPHYEAKKFEIQLEAINLAPLEKFRFNVLSKDYYPGQLIQDGITSLGDLIIHYTCSTP